MRACVRACVRATERALKLKGICRRAHAPPVVRRQLSCTEGGALTGGAHRQTHKCTTGASGWGDELVTDTQMRTKLAARGMQRPAFDPREPCEPTQAAIKPLALYRQTGREEKQSKVRRHGRNSCNCCKRHGAARPGRRPGKWESVTQHMCTTDDDAAGAP